MVFNIFASLYHWYQHRQMMLRTPNLGKGGVRRHLKSPDAQRPPTPPTRKSSVIPYEYNEQLPPVNKVEPVGALACYIAGDY